MGSGVARLRGREREQSAIDALLDGARGGTSGALVLRGEPGIGKTALLEYAAAAAGELRPLRGTGIEVEAELPFAGLQLLLRPALADLGALAEPQRAALASALGLEAGSGNDPMLVGLATLSLLTEYAGDTGALLLVDDAQWLDRASRDALLFAARRLHAEGVAMLFAARDGEGAFPVAGLSEHRLAGLSPEASAALLDEHDLTPALRYRLLAEAHGNPLALRELPVALAAERSADFRTGALPLTDRLRLAFYGQVGRLPEPTQRLLAIVAADETGALDVLVRAAAVMDAGIDDLAPAEAAGLLQRDESADTAVVFRHPLIRAVVVQRAPLGQRLAVHRALADALEAPEHADRRAWHLAAAATGPDEEVAAALEDTAARARERGGHEAAAAAYERAARLSVGTEARVRREASGAESALEAGDLTRAGVLARRAASRDVGEDLRARLTQVQAISKFWHGEFPDAHRLLVEAAARDIGPEQAAGMLLQAIHTGWYLGEGPLSEVLERLAALPLPDHDPIAPAARFVGRLLDRGPGPEPGALARTLAEIHERGRISDQLRLILCGVALARGQDGDADALATGLIAAHRDAGAAGRLPTALFFAAEVAVFTGRLRAARGLALEGRELARDTGQQQWVRQLSSVLAHLDALAGAEDECRASADTGLAGDTPGSIAPGAPWAHWSLGLLELGAGRAEAALSRFERLTREPLSHHICATRSVPDLVEAAVRVGAPERAAEAFARFEQWAESVRQPWADALVLRCRALLDGGTHAERLYTDALRVHDRDGRPVEYARTALLFGEWLRRGRRKAEARTRLDDALEILDRVGMRPWADRARAELTATGATENSPRAQHRSATVLTPQELQIVRLAARGLSNRDIAAQLFLSHRTVGYHLYKAYPKLGVTSRGELKGIAAELD
ncbi:helix-turn-helix transcriptional regulator [Nocardia mexicana]|uniref:Regulatory LuxR family protein n=1 Tax=Nocardia mexicana TaxID=279262 RepID=A0A370H9G1_9NOCA|nr:LuxR family transcriptional regulator [Nocardia mexicana]RDI53305.1 regulatory LuxR family protein [Nocardia mexicana]